MKGAATTGQPATPAAQDAAGVSGGGNPGGSEKEELWAHEVGDTNAQRRSEAIFVGFAGLQCQPASILLFGYIPCRWLKRRKVHEPEQHRFPAQTSRIL